MQCWGLISAAMAMGVIGCGDESARAPSEAAASRAGLAPMSPAPKEFRPEPQDAAGADKLAASEKQATANRKIIYNARVDLVTEDLNKLENALTHLVTARKAYVADSDRSGSAGENRHGTWKVRVPVENYDAFLKDSVALGELVSLKADSQDVSEEFYDLEARERAKKVEEERLLKHLSDSTGKLDEILAVERELTRVRSEIERMQGRLRVLGNLTSLATVTISAREIKGYIPPQAPTLATKVGRTFYDSLASLQQLGEALLLAVVALVPWLPLILLGVLIAFWSNRRIVAAARRALARTTDNPR
jgi:hypothetical protein